MSKEKSTSGKGEEGAGLSRRQLFGIIATAAATGVLGNRLLQEAKHPLNGESLQALSAINRAAETVAQAGKEGQRTTQRSIVETASVADRELVVSGMNPTGKSGRVTVMAALETANDGIFRDEDPAIGQDSASKARPAILLLTVALNVDAFDEADEFDEQIFQRMCQEYLAVLSVQPGQTPEEVQARRDAFVQNLLDQLGKLVDDKPTLRLQYLVNKS